MFYLAGADNALGAPFYVMERVIGHICRNELPDGYAEAPEDRRRIGEALVDALAALHTVDPADVGLAEFGRPAGFMERQLRRWTQQWEASKTGDLPALDGLLGDLAKSMPSQRAIGIVHGDYRLDNTILHPTQPGVIVAVLDWEMSTLGDPLADLGAMLAYWSEADDAEVLRQARIMAPVTAAEGFPSRSEIIERYSRRTGIDPSDLDWYQSFAYFKLAVVCQGIAARAAGGAMVGSGFEQAEALVAPLVEAGQHLLDARPTG